MEKKKSNAAPIYTPPKSGAKELVKPVMLRAISIGQYGGRVIYPGQKFMYNGKVKWRINRQGDKEYVAPNWTEVVDKEDNLIIVKDEKPSDVPPPIPSDHSKATAKELISQIEGSEDKDFLSLMLEDERKTVQAAAEKKLIELVETEQDMEEDQEQEGGASASDFV